MQGAQPQPVVTGALCHAEPLEELSEHRDDRGHAQRVGLERPDGPLLPLRQVIVEGPEPVVADIFLALSEGI